MVFGFLDVSSQMRLPGAEVSYRLANPAKIDVLNMRGLIRQNDNSGSMVFAEHY